MHLNFNRMLRFTLPQILFIFCALSSGSTAKAQADVIRDIVYSNTGQSYPACATPAQNYTLKYYSYVYPDPDIITFTGGNLMGNYYPFGNANPQRLESVGYGTNQPFAPDRACNDKKTITVTFSRPVYITELYLTGSNGTHVTINGSQITLHCAEDGTEGRHAICTSETRTPDFGYATLRTPFATLVTSLMVTSADPIWDFAIGDINYTYSPPPPPPSPSPTPTPTPMEPVVFVPGIGGSYLHTYNTILGTPREYWLGINPFTNHEKLSLDPANFGYKMFSRDVVRDVFPIHLITDV